jgi:hypothetical protein
MQRAGLRPVKVVFWNSVFTSFVEHVVMKLGEAALGRMKYERRTLKAGADESQLASEEAVQRSAFSVQRSEGTAREIRARQRMRGHLQQRGPAYYALMAVTLLMELDLWLFGSLRSGSYFIVVEKS